MTHTVEQMVFLGPMGAPAPVSLSRAFSIKDLQGSKVLLDGGGCEAVTEAHMESLKAITCTFLAIHLFTYTYVIEKKN